MNDERWKRLGSCRLPKQRTNHRPMQGPANRLRKPRSRNHPTQRTKAWPAIRRARPGNFSLAIRRHDPKTPEAEALQMKTADHLENCLTMFRGSIRDTETGADVCYRHHQPAPHCSGTASASGRLGRRSDAESKPLDCPDSYVPSNGRCDAPSRKQCPAGSRNQVGRRIGGQPISRRPFKTHILILSGRPVRPAAARGAEVSPSIAKPDRPVRCDERVDRASRPTSVICRDDRISFVQLWPVFADNLNRTAWSGSVDHKSLELDRTWCRTTAAEKNSAR